MMQPLRRRHVQVWRTWAVLLPVGIFLAWWAIPAQQRQPLLQPGSVVALPVVSKTVTREDYTINLRTDNKAPAWQLEWINRKVLRYPSATVYLIRDHKPELDEAILLGRIESKGNYLFPLPEATHMPLELLLYDFIHEQIIDTINIH